MGTRRWWLATVALLCGCGRFGFEARSAGDAGTDDSASDAVTDVVLTDLVSNLVAYWPLNEVVANSCGGANDACDATTHGFHGQWNGGASPAPGKFGNGILLSGNSQWIELGTTTVIDGTTPFTIAAWVRLDMSAGVNSQAAIFSRRVTNDPGYFQFSIGSYAPDDRLIVLDANGATGPAGYFATVEVPLATWHHVAVTSDALSVTFYLDGAKNTTVAYVPPTAANGLPQRLGAIADASSHEFPGMLDEVRIYARSLTSAEIAALVALTP